jgi:hypothetical protein
MASTPNFNWSTPDNTGLVKNGALDIRTLGNSIDASLVDLKGGTTGQVLAKASGTDMDFVWSADAAGISPTIFAAKGDLLGASANDTPAILSVGANGETVVADSSTATGLRYQSGYNGNAVINGGMDIWQRGTSIAYGINALVYAADRWVTIRVASPSNATASRQTSSLDGIQYCSRIARTAGDTSTAAIYYATSLESADSYRFANQTVTLSFYARAGANYSPTSGLLVVDLLSGTGSDQNVMNGLTGQATVGTTNAALTTSWTRYTITGTVASTATQLAIRITANPTGTAGAADHFEVTGVQLELGSVATNFKRTGGSIQGELAACQRYCIVYGEVDARGMASSATGLARMSATFPVEMRTAPSSSMTGTYSWYDGGTVGTFIAATAAFNTTVDSFALDATAATGTTAQYRPVGIIKQASNGTLTFSAEL